METMFLPDHNFAWFLWPLYHQQQPQQQTTIIVDIWGMKTLPPLDFRMKLALEMGNDAL
jgi:hypothetical protein